MTLPATFDAFVPNELPNFIKFANMQPRYVSLKALQAFPLDKAHHASLEYARKTGPEVVYNHSVRTYYFALAMLHSGYPSGTPGVRQLTSEELHRRVYHTCILHDVALTDSAIASNHPASGMSFELHGGIMAYEHLHAVDPSLTPAQVGDITQSIMLHTINLPGGIASTAGILLRLTALFDLHGYDALGPKSFVSLIHPRTVMEIEAAFPRGDTGVVLNGILSNQIENKPNCLMGHWPSEFFDRIRALKTITTEEDVKAFESGN